MAKPIVFILTLIILIGCVNRDKIVGIYTGKNFNGSINLRADSTFYYDYQNGLLNENSAGRWRIESGKVVLNSYTSTDSFYTLIESKQLNSDSFCVEIIDGNDEKLNYVHCFLYPKNKGEYIEGITNNKGICKFPRGDYWELDVVFIYNGFGRSIQIKNYKLDYYKIRVIPKDYSFLDFNNEKWKYHTRKIRNENNSIDNRIYIKQ